MAGSPQTTQSPHSVSRPVLPGDAAADSAAVEPRALPTGLSFPICRADGQAFTSLSDIETLLATESSGHFLLGANHSWHGGIHFSDRTVPQHRHEHPLRCMMDGTVVAYRLNRTYPRQSWMGKSLAYSTGFCLIRHDYCSARQDPAGEGGAGGECNRLRFYSLYLHLADYQSYQPTVTTARVVRLKQRLYVRRGENVQQRLGKLGPDSEITLLDEPSTSLVIVESTPSGARERTLRFIKGRVTRKAPGSQLRVGLHQEVWVADCEEYVEHLVRQQESGGRLIPGYWSSLVAGRLRNPYPIYRSIQALQRDDSPEGRLQVGSSLQFNRLELREVAYEGRQIQIAPCTLLEGISGSRAEPVTGLVWVVINEQTLIQQPLPPQQFEQIVECQIPIRAGEAIGFLGRYQTPAEPLALGHYTDEHRVHIELFSDESEVVLRDFLDNRAGLTQGASFVQLRGDEQLFDKQQQDGGCHFSERAQCPDPDQLVAIRHREQDAQGDRWCELATVRSGFASLNQVYVREQAITPISQFDLARLGFAVVDGGADGNGVVLQPSEVPSLFTHLWQQLDSNQDGQVDAAEIVAALRDVKHREQLQKCIIKHPSEWSPTWQQQVRGHLQQLKSQAVSLGREGEPLLQALELEEQRLAELVLDRLSTPLFFFHPLVMINQLMPVIAPLTLKSLTKREFVYSVFEADSYTQIAV